MNDKSSEFILVQTTSSETAVLEKIARQLVVERLAACVQISGPLTSYFSWDGKIDATPEWLCTIKTTRNAWRRVEQTIAELHNYELPEIIALPIEAGAADYFEWIRQNVSP